MGSLRYYRTLYGRYHAVTNEDWTNIGKSVCGADLTGAASWPHTSTDPTIWTENLQEVQANIKEKKK